MEKIILTFFVLLTLLFFIILPIENYSEYKTINKKIEIKNDISDYKNPIKSIDYYKHYNDYKLNSIDSFILPL